ncbi:MAG: hypothetical protein KKD99_03850 [Proteobacteria bacterium]|nr:hypothetical protein [Pseudomonadota bacterium]MBU4357451.1 hypothetical protein [Pseudomonadota bacterium]MBU4447699.1 hypothetical protein [Pseudomonadota bacterium]MCG2772211.1 hypothetical protein [Desulfobacterales bacterium]
MNVKGRTVRRWSRSRRLRHQSQATTARYVRVVDPQLREAMASLEAESHPKKRPMEAMSRN